MIRSNKCSNGTRSPLLLIFISFIMVNLSLYLARLPDRDNTYTLTPGPVSIAPNPPSDVLGVRSILFAFTTTNFVPSVHTCKAEVLVTATSEVVTDIAIADDCTWVHAKNLEPEVEHTCTITIIIIADNTEPADAESILTTASYPITTSVVVNKNSTISYETDFGVLDEPTSCFAVIVSGKKPSTSGEILECIDPTSIISPAPLHSSQSPEDDLKRLTNESYNGETKVIERILARKYNKKFNLSPILSKRWVASADQCLCENGNVVLTRPLGPREKVYLTDSFLTPIAGPLLVGDSETGVSTGEIIAIIIGSILFVALILLGIYLIRRKKR